MAKTNLPLLPAGPKGPGRFGAYYEHLKWDPEWDKPWRIGDHPDVVVRFDDGGHRLVFWHGTSYIPFWVTENGKWYTNEFVERRGHHSPNTNGCCEAMSDKQCRYSHVRIIESNKARAVVHWRYAAVDVRYRQPFIDEETGWGDWVDEYYTVYPDGVCVRKVTIQTSRPDLWTEFHEAIVVNQPGSMPEENIELGALSVANMKGESKTYEWTEDGAPGLAEFWDMWDANIILINLKSKRKPFSLVPPHDEHGLLITPYRGHAPSSHFNFWNHWPVAQVASDGTLAKTPDRPSHSALCHFGLLELASATWKFYEERDNLRTKIMLTGMTEKSVSDLVPQAKSWLHAPELKVNGQAYKKVDYDPTQRAYVTELVRSSGAKSAVPVKFEAEISSSEDSPLINTAFVITGWGEDDATISIKGNDIKDGKDVRADIRNTLQGDDLIVWIKAESTSPMSVTIAPA